MRRVGLCGTLTALAAIVSGGSELSGQSYHPTWSPDGRRLAYVEATAAGSDIVALDLGSGVATRLTDSGGKDYYPAWSPDGRSIAFVSERDGNPEVYVMASDGSRSRRLTRDPAADVHPAWSADGRFLAFDSDRHGPAEIFVVDLANGALRRITNNQSAEVFPAWSPGDSTLLVGSDRGGRLELHSVGLDGRFRERITGGEAGSMTWKSSWSPDGRAVAFAFAQDRNFDIYLRKTGSGAVARLTRAPSVERYPVWSPAGDRIAYVSNASGRLEVYYWDLSRWEAVQVTGSEPG